MGIWRFRRSASSNSPDRYSTFLQHRAIVRSSPQDFIDRRRPRIKSSVTVHDRTQVETVFDYNLGHLDFQTDLARHGQQDCTVEVFFFFPPQLAVTSQNYTAQLFYQDLRPLLRLRDPAFNYGDFLHLGSTGPRDFPGLSPLLIIHEGLIALGYLPTTASLGLPGTEQVRLRKKPWALEDLVDQVRLFGCCFSSYYHKRINRRTKALRELLKHRAVNPNAPGDLEAARSALIGTELLLRRSHRLLLVWEELLAQVRACVERPAELKNLLAEMVLTAEYCHYRFREGLATLAAALNRPGHQRAGKPAQGEGPSEKVSDLDQLAASLNARLRVWVRQQRWVALRHGFDWVDDTSSLAQQERFSFRRGHLKKHLWQVLYLEMQPRSSFIWRQQIGPTVAASLAMAWSLLVTALVLAVLGNVPNSAGGPLVGLNLAMNAWNTSAGLVALAAIGAYVARDRIKDFLKVRFAHGLLGQLPDMIDRVWYQTSSGQTRTIGSVEEVMRFFKSMDQVPAEIRTLRQGLPGIEIIGREKVLFYRKLVQLNPKALGQFEQPMVAVRDSIRFSVRRFLSTLDDPIQRYVVVNSAGETTTLAMPKTYHLDMVLRYSYRNGPARPVTIAADCHRLVLNKEGLVRIDRPGRRLGEASGKKRHKRHQQIPRSE